MCSDCLLVTPPIALSLIFVLANLFAREETTHLALRLLPVHMTAVLKSGQPVTVVLGAHFELLLLSISATPLA